MCMVMTKVWAVLMIRVRVWFIVTIGVSFRFRVRFSVRVLFCEMNRNEKEIEYLCDTGADKLIMSTSVVKGNFFSKIDMKSANHQIPMDENSVK